MNEKEMQNENTENITNLHELSENQKITSCEDEVVQENSTNTKDIVKIGVLVIDVLCIMEFLYKEGKHASTIITTGLTVLLIMVCIFVRLSSVKSEKKEIFQKIETYLSNALLSIILVAKILLYITFFGIMILKKPVDPEDYGYGILLMLPLLFTFFLDVYVYPFIFIYFDHKITKLILKSTLAAIIIIFLAFMLLAMLGELRS